jgi:TRAP-type transport system periplasmic protein
MKTLGFSAALAATAVAGMSSPVSAQETTLIFATTNPPQVHLNQRMHHPWAARISEKGKGVVKVDVRDGPTVANHLNFYQRTLDDVIQISWGLPGYVTGKFPLTSVAELPYVADKAEDASVALWRLYKSGALNSEFDEIVPLHLIIFPQLGIHLAKEPRTLESLSGAKIGAGTKVTSEIVSRLDGAPISIPLTSYYESVQRGTIDGTISQWTQFQPFKLGEVTFYHIDTTLGGSAGMTFMSKKKFEGLPAAARKIIEEESGEKQSRLFGKFWDDVNDEGRQAIKGMGDKHKIVTLSEDQKAKWDSKIKPLTEDWIKTTPGSQKILDAFKAELAKVKAGG